MRTIYIDDELKCHVSNNGSMTAIETDFFDGKCDEWIECYRFVPEDREWENADGVVFSGMVAPWKPLAYSEQRKYERQLLAEYETVINELYSEVTN